MKGKLLLVFSAIIVVVVISILVINKDKLFKIDLLSLNKDTEQQGIVSDETDEEEENEKEKVEDEIFTISEEEMDKLKLLARNGQEVIQAKTSNLSEEEIFNIELKYAKHFAEHLQGKKLLFNGVDSVNYVIYEKYGYVPKGSTFNDVSISKLYEDEKNTFTKKGGKYLITYNFDVKINPLEENDTVFEKHPEYLSGNAVLVVNKDFLIVELVMNNGL